MQKRHFRPDKSIIRAWGTICCTICMMFMLVTGTENAYAQETAEIVAVSSTAEKGGTAKVSLNLTGNPGIWGVRFKVEYDHTVMTLKSVEVGSVFTENEVLIPEDEVLLDSDYFVFYASGNKIENISTNGTLAILEFQISETAAEADYAVSLEFIQCINVDDNDVNLTMKDGKVTVVNCLHSEKEWKVTTPAKCEQPGTETESCKKCGQEFGTRAIEATGHKNTEIINAADATEEKAGYTGDTYCNDCKQVIKKGTYIPKLEKPEEKLPETGQSVSPAGILAVLFILAIAGDMIFMKKKFIQ